METRWIMYKSASRKIQAYANGDFGKSDLTTYFPYFLEDEWKKSGQYRYRSRKDFLSSLQGREFPIELSDDDFDPSYKIWFGKYKNTKLMDIKDDKYLTWVAFKYWDEHPRLVQHILYIMCGKLVF